MPIPTPPGDVLVLQTERGVKIQAVGRVTRRGQEHFRAVLPPRYIKIYAEAFAVARTLVAPGRLIYLVKIDRIDWAEIAS
jgi:hypothetical protein